MVVKNISLLKELNFGETGSISISLLTERSHDAFRTSGSIAAKHSKRILRSFML
jgi:hypothetical protein